MSVHTPIETGFEFVGYRLEELIGQGGMGVVYRAYDLRLKRTVALKLVTPELELDERFHARFARESELAMSLEHPNVVPIYDAGDVDGRLYLAMRHVQGTDLRTLLRAEGALDPRRALTIIAQVAAALDAAHGRGLVHRDVKPSNVLLDAGEHVYLADFGLTRRLDEQGAQLGDGRSLGTPAYLAPEQIEGAAVDGRADIYSLGCLLYECLTGEAPVVRDSRLAVAWAHLEEEPPTASEHNPQLPAELDAVLRQAMAKEPADRHPTCSELVAAAEATLGLRRRSGLRRGAAVVVALLALAALLAVVVGQRGDTSAGSGLVVSANTLVRVDPSTNAVTQVIDVGEDPAAIAVGGRSVWVYSAADSTLSEIDSVTRSVRHTTPVSIVPLDLGPLTGPILAADTGGAWFVGWDPESGDTVLTRILPGGLGTRAHTLTGQAGAVVVADGSAWVLVHRGASNAVLRLDLETGAVRGRVRLPSGSAEAMIDGLAVGGGFVWATESRSAILHRVDLVSGATHSRDLGTLTTSPVFGFGWLWLCADTPDRHMLRVDPRTLRSSLARNALPAENGRFAVGHGSLWRHDLPSGTVMRFDARTGDPAGIIRVIPPGPADTGLSVTSIAAGAGGVWATFGAD
jgi:hypothetical protein